MLRTQQSAPPAGGALCCGFSDESLDGDAGAGRLEGFLGLVGSFLVGLLQDRLRSTLDEVLGLLETKTRDRADFLDDLDLLVAGTLEDDVELVLVTSVIRAGSSATGSGRGSSHGNRSGRGDVE